MVAQNLPAEHAVGTVREVEGQKELRGQGVVNVRPVAPQKLPTGHGVPTLRPDEGQNAPRTQVFIVVSPVPPQ